MGFFAEIGTPHRRPALVRLLPALGVLAVVASLAAAAIVRDFRQERRQAAARIEATAELPDEPAAAVMPDGFGAKYRELLHRAGLTVQRFAEVYSQPIVLRPTRFLGYGGHGWDTGSALAT